MLRSLTGKDFTMRRLFILFAMSLLLFSCGKPELKSGIDKSNFDLSVRPQDDFYRYVNGTWLKKTEIPADKSDYGAFTQLYDESRKALREIIEEAARSKNEPGSDRQKVGDFYLSFMDSSRLEELGIRPIEPVLKQIQQVQSLKDLEELFAQLKPLGVQTPFSMWVGQDAKHSDRYILYLNQSGLGLPDRDYYLKNEKKFQDVRAAYQRYIAKLFELAQLPDGEKAARRILAMETAIAGKHWSRVKSRNRDLTYNLYSVKELNRLTPQFDWIDFMKRAGAEKADQVVVRQPDYIKSLNKILTKYSVDDWKNYLTFKTLSRFAGYLNHDFVETSFEFYGKTLRGIPQIRPRWKRGVSTVEGALGEVLGRIYVGKYFKPEAKE
ncbi:MAG TPA: peptidase M13, partial [Caldithrix abyssi]|nr:peptidase M13 [Caldithrix abyssi]